MLQLTERSAGRIDQTHIPFEPADADNFVKINTLLVTLSSELPTSHDAASKDARIKKYDDITISAWLDQPDVAARPHVKAALKAGVHALWGVEPDELPMSFLMHDAATAGEADTQPRSFARLTCVGGWLPLISNDGSGAQYQRTRDGTQGISVYLASLLPEGSVKLNSPVQSITQSSSRDSSGSVIVSTRSGEIYTANRVICTIPSPLYGTITWSPLLPTPQQALAQRAFLGILGKCIAIYPKPWWREAGWSGTHQSSEGPLSVILDTCDTDLSESQPGGTQDKGRQYSLTGFVAGRNAVKFFAPDQTDDDRKAASLTQLSRLFNGHPDAQRPSQMIFENWMDEEFSQGAPCPILPTGALGDYGQYYGERHGGVFFAGTEYSEVWKGYMEGAVHSGRETARAVLGDL